MYMKIKIIDKNNTYSINIRKPLSNLRILHINKSLITKFNEFYFPNLSELYINDSIIEEIKNCYLMGDLKTLSVQSKTCLTKYLIYIINYLFSIYYIVNENIQLYI